MRIPSGNAARLFVVLLPRDGGSFYGPIVASSDGQVRSPYDGYDPGIQEGCKVPTSFNFTLVLVGADIDNFCNSLKSARSCVQPQQDLYRLVAFQRFETYRLLFLAQGLGGDGFGTPILRPHLLL